MPQMLMLTPLGVKSWPLAAVPVTGETAPPAPSDVLQAYQRVPWLYRAVNAVAGAVGSAPYSLTHTDDLPESAFPCAVAWSDMFDQCAAWLLLYGAAYVRLERNRFGVLRGLRPLHPNTLQPHYSAALGLTGYTRRVGAESYALLPSEVGRIWLPNRAAETGSDTAPAQVALRAAGVLANLDTYTEAYFANGAVNPTLVSITGGGTRSDFERLRNWYKRVLTGVRRAFNLEVVEGEVKTTSIGYPLSELATPELTSAKREDIATALGVPQTLLFSNAANYATAAQDDLHFYEKTVRPLTLVIENALNQQVLTPLGWRLRFHLEQLEVYQRREADKAAGVVALVERGIMSQAEARAYMGLVNPG